MRFRVRPTSDARAAPGARWRPPARPPRPADRAGGDRAASAAVLGRHRGADAGGAPERANLAALAAVVLVRLQVDALAVAGAEPRRTALAGVRGRGRGGAAHVEAKTARADAGAATDLRRAADRVARPAVAVVARRLAIAAAHQHPRRAGGRALGRKDTTHDQHDADLSHRTGGAARPAILRVGGDVGALAVAHRFGRRLAGVDRRAGALHAREARTAHDAARTAVGRIDHRVDADAIARRLARGALVLSARRRAM